MSTYSPAVTADAAAYAAAVRSHLADLQPDVVEELVGGLEADLAELAAERPGTLGERIGDPASYAAELRASAGLPPAPVRRGGAPGALAAELAQARQQWSETREALSRTRWWGPVSSAVVELRPAWWLARAWVAYQVLDAVLTGGGGSVLPQDPLGALVLLLMAAASVALGRGWPASLSGAGWVVVAGNVLALLLLPAAASHASSDGYRGDVYVEPPPGLTSDGVPVTNVFPYGPDGEPLTGVTLLDQDGNPLSVVPGYGDQGVVGVPLADGSTSWSTFPLPTVPYDEPMVPDEQGMPVLPEGVEPEPAAPPLLRVPAVETPAPADPPPPSPSPSPTPTGTPAPTTP